MESGSFGIALFVYGLIHITKKGVKAISHSYHPFNYVLVS